MEHLKKELFLESVKNHLYKHPEWLEDVINVLSQSVLKKCEDNRKTSVEIQTSLALLYGNQYGKLQKPNQIKVNRAILECDTFEGTIFGKKVTARLNKLESKED